MYDDWIENAIRVCCSYEKLCIQKDEIEKRIGILQAMAKQLVEEGADNFYRRKIFPQGRSHFNRFMYKLIKIVEGKSLNNYAKQNEVV